jgi:hypothetical protein
VNEWQADPEAPFEEPWQARLFAMTQGVLGAGNADRERFRRQLIAAVAGAPERPYWESWLAAFEAMLVDAELVMAHEFE